MAEKVKKYVIMALVVTLILVLIISQAGILGMINLTNGCLLRYSGGTSYTDVLSHSVTLQATANYNTLSSEDGGKITNTPDPTAYGQWVDTGISVTEGQDITLVVSSGSVSLCQAFLPAYNPEQNTAAGTITPYKAGGDINPITKAPIPIPRVGDSTSLTILLDAKQGYWFNVAKIDQYDQVAVSLQPSKQPVYSNGIKTSDVSNLSYISSITGATTPAINCSEGRSSYHPLCGIYSVYPIGKTYGTGCHKATYTCNKHCTNNVGGICYDYGYDDCPYWVANDTANYPYKTIPSYQSNGQYTMPYSTDIPTLINYNAYPLCSTSNSANGGDNCNNNHPSSNTSPKVSLYNNGNFCYTYCTSTNPNDTNCKNNTDFAYPAPTSPGFWFRADDGTGLLYRFDTSLKPTKQTKLGTPVATGTPCAPGVTGYCFSPKPSSSTNILTFSSASATSQYLQFRLLDNDNQYTDNTGGYVLNIQQTKCQRTAGSYATDSYPNRGQIQYVIVPTDGTPPTNSAAGGTTGTGLTFDATNQVVITPASTGTLWMIITNNFADYQYSVGQYDISVQQQVATSQFGNNVLAPLLALVRSKVDSAGELVFKNMTCYQSSPGPCTNFFNYISGLLTLYIMIFGLTYLAGMTEITTEDLVIRVAKIALVAGLMNGDTYNFFNQYVFDFATGFSDEIISNIAGYNLYSNGGAVNPLMFADGLMTKIFFSKTTFAQMLALFSFGISGIFFFFMVFMSLMMILAAIFRSFVVYIMAFVAIAFLLSLAPLFLTFMLFEQTYYLFEGWTRAIFRFMIEPIILFAGIIILTQLAEIYLDNILGWSVCWKCTLAFSLPFPSFPLEPSFLTQPLFCINWFAPWGYDYRSGLMGLGMQDMAGFAMIAFCAYGYGDFAEKITNKITGNVAGPTANSAAKPMTAAVVALSNKAMSKVASKVTGHETKIDLTEKSFERTIGKARGAVGAAATKLLKPEGRAAAGAKLAGAQAGIEAKGNAEVKKFEGAARKLQALIKRGK